MNDQEAKADAGKLRLGLVPIQIMYDIAMVREHGCKKYPNGGVDNWKQVDSDRYFEAMLRHIFAAWDDRTARDEESGLPHMFHAAANMSFLLELEKDKYDISGN